MFHRDFIPRRCSAGPARRFSLCPGSPAPPGQHMFWVLGPVWSALHLGPLQALNVLPLSVHHHASPAPSLRPFSHLHPGTPAVGPAPVPAGSPRSPDLGPRGYSGARQQGWNGFPESNGCHGRRQRRRWSCSLWACRRCRGTSPC